jgi:hypothetical protein
MVTTDSVLANSKTQNAFLSPILTMFHQDCLLVMIPENTSWHLLICSFLLCLSWLPYCWLQKFHRDIWMTLYFKYHHTLYIWLFLFIKPLYAAYGWVIHYLTYLISTGEIRGIKWDITKNWEEWWMKKSWPISCKGWRNEKSVNTANSKAKISIRQHFKTYVHCPLAISEHYKKYIYMWSPIYFDM